MNSIVRHFIIWCIFLMPVVLQAQKGSNNKPLVEILSELQTRFHYQFTYADADIKNIYVKNLPENLDLKKSIDFISQQTHLVFQFLDHHFIAIKKPNKPYRICGYLIDNQSGFPVEKATLNTQSGYAISNHQGYFELKVKNDQDSIYVRHLSYKNQIITPKKLKNKCQKIYLTSSVIELSRIVLKNIMVKGIDKTVDGSIKINLKKLGILPGLIEPDVLQTIQALPGIQSVNETVSHINIHGGTNDQNLLLWNGIRMYQSGHFFGLISVFNPLTINEVKVVKSGSNVDLGNAVSGSILMDSSSKIDSETKANIGSNFINADIFSRVPLGKKSSLQIGARKAISNWLTTPTYSQYYKRILQNTSVENHTNQVLNSDISFDFYDISLHWIYRLSDKDLLRFNFINISDRFKFTKTAVIAQQSESKQSSLLQKNMAFGLYYKKVWKKDLTTILQAYETDYALKANNVNLLEEQRLLQENKVSETSVKLNAIYRMNPQLTVLSGYQFIENGTTNLTDIDHPLLVHSVLEVIREHSIFAQIQWLSKAKKIHLKTGVRFNYNEKFNQSIVEPRFSFNYKFTKHFNLELLGEYKHQNISQIINLQNDFLGIEKRRWRLANNKNIPVIRGKNISLGFNYHKKSWLINLETYYKIVNGITSQSQGFVNQYIYKKAVGSYRVKGLDFLINKRTGNMSLWLSYALSKNDYTFKSFKEITFPNNLDIRHIVSVGTSYTYKKLNASIGLNWHTGTPTTVPVKDNEITGNHINFDTANATRLDDYMRIDFSANYQFSINDKIKGHIGASLWNILNRQNILKKYYQVNQNQTVLITSQNRSV